MNPSKMMRRLTTLLAILAIVAAAAIASATVHPLGGNGRYQIGKGLPIPATFQPAPNGALLPVTGAVVTQTGSDPMALRVPNGAMKAAQVPFVVGVAVNNPAVYQVQTNIGITFPSTPSNMNTWSAGGRTGGATVSYCPGQTVPPGGNPGCASGLAGPHPSVKGIMIYTATSNQFGGPMSGRVYGNANVAFLGTQPAPCTGCLALFGGNTPDSTGIGAAGNAFGPGSTGGAVTLSPGRISGTISAGGLISNAMVTASSLPGVPNPGTNFAGPFTTGMLTIIQPLALGGIQAFTLTGSDNRVSGVGSISLVAGGLSNRFISGPGTARSWSNLTIGAPLGALPSMNGVGAAALIGLMSVAGGYAMHRRRK